MKDRDKKIHFIGIGGISMSGIVEILLQRGFKISGSDMNSSPITNRLKTKGAKIYIGHTSDNIRDVDLIVYTAAISNDNPELVFATSNNIETMDRAEFLGEIMKAYKYNVAIAGTHGKTTTTSMVSHIVLKANLDPTILVGGQLDLIAGNVKTGESDYFITEACEYKASFLKFSPYIGTILNIDADHLDYYKDIDEITEAFIKFAKLIPKNGYLVAYGEDLRINQVIKNCNCTVITYGLNSGDLIGKNIIFDKEGCASFDVYKKDSCIMKVRLNVPGNHNILNSLAAVATGIALNIDLDTISQGLESFLGTHRRFELKGVKNQVTVIDDYAHHPTEIKATLSATKNYPHNKLYAIFQPHTYTRTSTLFSDFVQAFDDCYEVILADIYAAREKDTGIVSSLMLGDKIREKGQKCVNFHSFEDIVKYLNHNAKAGDLIMTIGAGDVFKIGEMYLKQ